MFLIPSISKSAISLFKSDVIWVYSVNNLIISSTLLFTSSAASSLAFLSLNGICSYFFIPSFNLIMLVDILSLADCFWLLNEFIFKTSSFKSDK